MIKGNSGKGNSRCKGQVKEARGHDGDKIVRETKQLGQTEVERLANAEQEGILFTVLISLNLMLETTNNEISARGDLLSFFTKTLKCIKYINALWKTYLKIQYYV